MKTKQNNYLAIFLSLGVVVLFILFHFLHKKTTVASNISPLYKQISKTESCTLCHSYTSGFSKHHDPKNIGCVACHLGNPAKKNKKEAHLNLISIPGNLSNASQTCGKCHQGIPQRIMHSPMNTMSGVVSIDKYVFGENNDLDSLFQIHHIDNKSLGEKHLRNKCASCHLGNEKTKTNPISERSRGGGCLACHLNYTEGAKKGHFEYQQNLKLPQTHASINLQITDKHCFGCHSRSGRISTNYQGWHETQLKADSITDFKHYRILEDKRVFVKKQADIHQQLGMSCIDCHDTWDVMGTGQYYNHQEDAVSTTCTACHSKDLQSVAYQDLDPSDKRMLKKRNIDTTKHYLKADNKMYYNVLIEANKATLITKNTHKSIALKDDYSNCLRNNAHQSVSCSSCHTAWAPQCISCHTNYDKEIGSYDLLSKKEVDGAWLEKGAHYLASFPTLGVVTKQGKRTIKTVAPGMIMTLEKKQSKSFHRLFAPVSAHTISKETPRCKACHLNPLVLGYGRGELTINSKKKWLFKPLFDKHQDELPQDAWIPFLKNDTVNKATRKNLRPFSKKEQQKILTVGACLTCHKEKSSVTKLMLSNYPKALEKRSKQCIVPLY